MNGFVRSCMSSGLWTISNPVPAPIDQDATTPAARNGRSSKFVGPIVLGIRLDLGRRQHAEVPVAKLAPDLVADAGAPDVHGMGSELPK
jgi:hypothetical protein